MGGEQFSDKDRNFVDDALASTNVPYGEPIIIKKFTGIADPGDPARGILPRLGFSRKPVKAVVDSVSQQDVLYSGGLYQLGDISITLKEKLNIMDTTQQIGGQSQGDRIIYEKHEYRIVGKQDTHSVLGKEVLFSYVFRKVGNS